VAVFSCGTCSIEGKHVLNNKVAALGLRVGLEVDPLWEDLYIILIIKLSTVDPSRKNQEEDSLSFLRES
jgi:hypothetical protein